MKTKNFILFAIICIFGIVAISIESIRNYIGENFVIIFPILIFIDFIAHLKDLYKEIEHDK